MKSACVQADYCASAVAAGVGGVHPIAVTQTQRGRSSERGATCVGRLLRATAARAAAPRSPRGSTHRLHRHHGSRPHRNAARNARPPANTLQAYATQISMFFFSHRACRATEGRCARTAVRGAGPARCVTHPSRRFLACSRNRPSAE
ncbi:unnamed protein product, partial [Iphiclides podalirius]